MVTMDYITRLKMNNKYSRATVVVAVLAAIAISAMSIGIYKLFCLQKGDECAITVQFNGSKATYLGKVV
jgi:hypothetical protein